MCRQNARCSCRGGGCSSCGYNNREIEYANSIIALGVEPELAYENKELIKFFYHNELDNLSAYEYITWKTPTPKTLELVEKFKKKQEETPVPTVMENENKVVVVDEVVDTSTRINPEKECKYQNAGIWERCVYCNNIRKYMKDKQCPKYVGDLENKEEHNELQ